MRTSRLALAILGLAFAGSVAANDGPTLYKSKTCIACHGVDGAKPILPTYPKIAGQNKDYAINQMKDIKSGARNNATRRSRYSASGFPHSNDANLTGAY